MEPPAPLLSEGLPSWLAGPDLSIPPLTHIPPPTSVASQGTRHTGITATGVLQGERTPRARACIRLAEPRTQEDEEGIKFCSSKHRAGPHPIADVEQT